MTSRTITTDFLTASADQTLARIRWFIALEARPRTLNEAYYSDYHAKFLSQYKGWRPIEAEADDDNGRHRLALVAEEAGIGGVKRGHARLLPDGG